MIERHVAADVAVATDNRIAHGRVAADAAVRPDDGALDRRVLFDLRLPPDDGVRADAGAGLDEHPLVHETGPLDRGALLDPGIGRDGRARPAEPLEWRRNVAPVHDVAMDLRVLFRGPDVDPVALVDVGDEGLAPLDQRREIAALDRPRHLARNAVERVRLEDVDAGVDLVGRDLVRLRLLEKPGDV